MVRLIPNQPPTPLPKELYDDLELIDTAPTAGDEQMTIAEAKEALGGNVYDDLPEF